MQGRKPVSTRRDRWSLGSGFPSTSTARAFEEQAVRPVDAQVQERIVRGNIHDLTLPERFLLLSPSLPGNNETSPERANGL